MIETIEAEARRCRECAGVHEYERVVVAEGRLDAPILLIGQDPGATELEEGRPFCGPSGKLLRETLEMVGIRPEDRIITNINYHRSRNNAGFPLTERRKCWDRFGERLLAASRARVIVPVGQKAVEVIFELFHEDGRPKLKDVAGRQFLADLGGRIRYIIPCFHPAFVLRGGGMFSDRHMDMVEQLLPVGMFARSGKVRAAAQV